MSRTCWLCTFNRDEHALRLTKFLNDNAANMGTAQLAQAVHESLEEIDPEGEGHSVEDIRLHIEEHMITPNVKIPCMLRSLISLLGKLEDGMMSTNEDTNTTTIDCKNVLAYLKVVNEIKQIYQTSDVSKLMFAEGSGGVHK